MGRRDKAIERFSKLPKDFTYREMKTLLERCGYLLDETRAGSCVAFTYPEDGDIIMFHRPHGGDDNIKGYVMKQVFDKLKRRGLI